jgi:hypothetical protein
MKRKSAPSKAPRRSMKARPLRRLEFYSRDAERAASAGACLDFRAETGAQRLEPRLPIERVGTLGDLPHAAVGMEAHMEDDVVRASRRCGGVEKAGRFDLVLRGWRDGERQQRLPE